MNASINTILNSFSSISLEAVGSNSLMKRVCTKFIVNENETALILENITSDYFILEINKVKIHAYSSLYFDTITKQFYHDHHNEKANRVKVRIRKYEENNLYFLEVKQKNVKGITNKSRKPITHFEEKLSESSLDFIKAEAKKDYKLSPSIWSKFNRITLINKFNKERLTLDFNLSDNVDKQVNTYNNLVVIEVKQASLSQNSPIIKTLKKFGHRPYGISKYCIGMISHYKDIKYNRFKPKLLKINKLIN